MCITQALSMTGQSQSVLTFCIQLNLIQRSLPANITGQRRFRCRVIRHLFQKPLSIYIHMFILNSSVDANYILLFAMLPH